MSRLGVFLKKLRIERGEILYDMATRLGVSPAFLSAVENSKRSAPATWLDIISVEYSLSEAQYRELADIISESIRQIRLDVSQVDTQKRNCALTFARNFDDFSDEEIRNLMAIMEKRG